MRRGKRKYEEVAGLAIGPGLREIKKITFRKAADEYLENVTSGKCLKNQNNEKFFFERMDKFILSKKRNYMHEITTQDILEFQKLCLKSMTGCSLNRRFNPVRNFFTMTLDWGYVYENVFKKVKKQKEDSTPPEVWRESDFKKFIKTTEGPWRNMLVFMWLTGCRAKEAENLKWSDIDQDRGIITLQCGKLGRETRKREFPITDELSEFLHKIKLEGLHLFMVDRHPIDGNNLWQYCKWRLRRLGLGHLTPRGMRRTFGTNLSDAKENAFLIRDLMGHAKVETTLKYIQKNESNMLVALKKVKR